MLTIEYAKVNRGHVNRFSELCAKILPFRRVLDCCVNRVQQTVVLKIARIHTVLVIKILDGSLPRKCGAHTPCTNEEYTGAIAAVNLRIFRWLTAFNVDEASVVFRAVANRWGALPILFSDGKTR
ncbi:hypothetical protein [Paraburkholderia sacchari]|uniref:hypothetical protein n=1 Tax=Paraburkholderia sacchari TaxID=159450 RepID=UPI0039A7453D